MYRAPNQLLPANSPERRGSRRAVARQRVPGLTLGLTCWLAACSIQPAHAELRQFANWIAGCDNKAECTAVGTAAGGTDPAAPSVAIRIGVDRTSLSGFVLAIVRLPANSADLRPIVINSLPSASETGAADRPGAERIELAGQRIELADMRGARWLDIIGRGTPLAAAWSDGTQRITIDTAAFLEAWQHLARTRGALLREALAADLLTSPHANSAADGQRAGPAVELMPSGAPAIEPVLQRCPMAADAARYRLFALPGTARLWSLTCRRGDVVTSHWFQAEGPVGELSPLLLPDAERGLLNAGDPGFAESLFDFDFGILRARSGPAGRDDCGVQRAWGWTGKTWVLLERREMPACIGLEPSDWVRTYAAP